MGREEKWFEKLEGQARFYDELELSYRIPKHSSSDNLTQLLHDCDN